VDWSKKLKVRLIAAWGQPGDGGGCRSPPNAAGEKDDVRHLAATLMARYRSDELESGDVSLLIGLLGKIGFSPSERGRMNLPEIPVRMNSSGK
jgi:hypothetical protein